MIIDTRHQIKNSIRYSHTKSNRDRMQLASRLFKLRNRPSGTEQAVLQVSPQSLCHLALRSCIASPSNRDSIIHLSSSQRLKWYCSWTVSNGRNILSDIIIHKYPHLRASSCDCSTLKVVANYFGSRQEYEPVAGKKIHWAGNRTAPPVDIPACGYTNEKCRKLPSVGWLNETLNWSFLLSDGDVLCCFHCTTAFVVVPARPWKQPYIKRRPLCVRHSTCDVRQNTWR